LKMRFLFAYKTVIHSPIKMLIEMTGLLADAILNYLETA